ncbi:MAG TPA: hypothetical protein VEC11_17115 [Allosphingosinicella sp.]|nr:hypothetical protein [Allosphingosinicella sp.]
MATQSLSTAGGRSPRFPFFPLSDAISYAEKIYQGVHRSPVDSLTAYKLMGFTGKTGSSSKALGAARQFGLVEGTGDRTRITDLALKIFEPASPNEKAEAINDAARRPELYNQILSRFEGRIPSADEPLRAFLIREAGFSKTGADSFLESFRATLNYVGQFVPMKQDHSDQDNDRQEGDGNSLQQEVEETPVGDSVAPSEPSRLERSGEVFRVPVARHCIAELRFEGPVTAIALDKLVKHIELMKEVWAEG